MRKMKAVVLEKSGSHYTVLDHDGNFRQVHRRLNAEVGEEIQIHHGLSTLVRYAYGLGLGHFSFWY